MLSIALLSLAVVTLLAHFAMVLDLALGCRKTGWLRDVDVPDKLATLPLLSVIVPARNEARHIEQALGSLLAQDYPRLEFVVVNDRSDDDTGTILDRMAAADPRLQVVHIDRLPAGWLGKNHAVHLGGQRAKGELLLFTDADVVMRPDTLSRAVVAIQRRALVLLAVTPDVPMPNPWLEAFAAMFGLNFLIYLRPWKARDPNSKRFIGIGAFTLVRAAAYRAVGGHEPIAMRPDDDIMLGKLMKKNRYRQDFMFGNDLLSVEWYASLGEMINGLMKNAFAGLNYRVSTAIAASVGQFMLYVWPYAALLLTHGLAWWINLTIVIFITNTMLVSGKFWRWAIGWRMALGMPVMALLLIYIIWRATLLTLINGGIRWRDTHYPLKALKANRV